MHISMKLLSTIILCGFISLSVFGFIGMLQSSDTAHAQNTCLASLAQNGACPPQEKTIASAIFHTNAFKVFSTTIAIASAILSLVFIFAGLITPLLQDSRLAAQTRFGRIQDRISRYLALYKLKSSLVRFEHSPTS